MEPNDNKISAAVTLMHMSYGQFLSHESERTALTQLATSENGKHDVIESDNLQE